MISLYLIIYQIKVPPAIMNGLVQSNTCPLCGLAFENEHRLQTHMISHSDTRNHACGECDARFKTAVVLKQHKSVHTQERRFQCDLCEDRFRQLAHMLRHRRTVHRDINGEIFREIWDLVIFNIFDLLLCFFVVFVKLCKNYSD